MSTKIYDKSTHRYIAIDWDGTIAEDNTYPNVSHAKPEALKCIKRMIADGYKLCIWTCRGGNHIEQIESLLSDNGIERKHYYINEHFEYFLDSFPEQSPKIYADVYIDDRNFRTTKIDWTDVEIAFFGNIASEDIVVIEYKSWVNKKNIKYAQRANA